MVSSFDLSTEGVNYLNNWATKEKLAIDTKVADMLSIPYHDDSFDCLFTYHVISHTNTMGIQKIMREIKRITKPSGEMYITLCSKETWAFAEAGFPQIDDNTIRKTEDGPEKDVPHFYVNLNDIIKLFTSVNIELLRIRHTDDCYFDDKIR